MSSDCGSLTSLLIYCVFSSGSIGYFEVYAIWAYTKPHVGEFQKMCLDKISHLRACDQVVCLSVHPLVMHSTS